MIVDPKNQWCDSCIKKDFCPSAGIPITIVKEQECWTNGLQNATSEHEDK